MRSVRGCNDSWPKEERHAQWILAQARFQAHSFGYAPISTPILEFEDVFARSLGESSDIVNKEMFYIQNRSSEDPPILLRPEGTAPIMRALHEAGLHQTLPQRLYYSGPMFRYDRPQKGRLRQFHQFGVEALGVEGPWGEIESILLAWQFITSLNLNESPILSINTLGSPEDRAHYTEALRAFLLPFEKDLSVDSQMRLIKNPLRILDSKSPQDQAFLKEAPLLSSSLSPASTTHFHTIQEELSARNIPFIVSPHLVRGLDYYTHGVFEISIEGLALMGGGRYDALAPSMGFSPLPAVGWAAGIERLALYSSPPQEAPLVVVFSLEAPHTTEAFSISQILRQKLPSLAVTQLYEGKVQQKFKKADRLGAHSVVFFGEDELRDQKVVLKNLQTGEQETFPVSELINHLASIVL